MALPAAIPVTIPVALTVAFVTSLLLQVPPLTDAVRVDEVPMHTVVEPLIVPALGAGFTVIACVAEPVPQLLVTV